MDLIAEALACSDGVKCIVNVSLCTFNSSVQFTVTAPQTPH